MINRAAPAEPRDAWVGRVQELVKEWKAEVEHLVNSEILPMRPERLCRELSDYLPSDAILVSDTGHAGVWTGTMLDLNHTPTRAIFAAQGHWAGACLQPWVPSAPGPDRPVLCFTGDGGIWYHIAELETAARCGINTVTVVNNNHSLNQEQGGVEQIYGGRTAGSDELWLFEDADFARIAESFGALGITVNKPEELPGALDRAFASGRPAVVDVKTHVEGIAPRAWMPPG